MNYLTVNAEILKKRNQTQTESPNVSPQYIMHNNGINCVVLLFREEWRAVVHQDLIHALY